MARFFGGPADGQDLPAKGEWAAYMMPEATVASGAFLGKAWYRREGDGYRYDRERSGAERRERWNWHLTEPREEDAPR